MRRSRRGGLAATLLLGLAGGLAMAVGAGRPWYVATARQRGLPEIAVEVTGTELVPVASALGLVALAGFGAVLATRGTLRRAVGALVAAVSVVVAALTARPPAAMALARSELAAHGWSSGAYDVDGSGWRWLVLSGAVAGVVAGLTVLRRGAQWSSLGPEYDAPSSPSRQEGVSHELTEAEVWREIDAGRDPTQGR